MAKLTGGILGPVSGKIGRVVLCHRKNSSQSYIRSLPKVYHDRKSPAQMRNRMTFLFNSTFFSPFKELCAHLLKKSVEWRRMSTYNLVEKLNYHTILTFKDESLDYKVNYDKILFSQGRLAPIGMMFVLPQHDGLALMWDNCYKDGLDGTDRLQVAVYDEDRMAAASFIDVARRSDGMCVLPLKECWLKDRLHIYVSCLAEDGTCSTSAYYCYGEEEVISPWIDGNAVLNVEPAEIVLVSSELDLSCLAGVKEQTARKVVAARARNRTKTGG